jgi:uncharacterized membrane protein
MFCQKCGKEIADDAVVCIGCGRAIKQMHTIQQPDRRVKKANLWLFLGFGISYIVLNIFATLYRGSDFYNVEKTFSAAGMALSLLNSVLYTVTIILFCIYLYRAWKMIQDGYASTTPGKAVGFIFIPFFNFYWLFQALWGWSKDYSSFIYRNTINAPRMPQGLFFTCGVLYIFSVVISLMSIIIVFSDKRYFVPYLSIIASTPIGIIFVITGAKICQAVNFFADRKV